MISIQKHTVNSGYDQQACFRGKTRECVVKALKELQTPSNPPSTVLKTEKRKEDSKTYLVVYAPLTA